MVRDGFCGVSVDALKNCCSHSKLILCCFWFIISPHTKFHPNRTKNKEVRNFHFWSILVGRLVGQKMVVGISKSFYVVFAPLFTHIPNFIQIRQKTQKLKIFPFGRFWLVGLVGQKMVVGISNSFYVVFAPLLAPIPNFIQIGQKTRKLQIFTFGQFWLVGPVGRKWSQPLQTFNCCLEGYE